MGNSLIKHLRQPTSNSCVITCIAMAAGLTQEQLDKDFATGGELKQLHDAFALNPSVDVLIPYLRSKRISFALPNYDAFVTDDFYEGWNYLLIVPSLGVIQGKLHCVLLECPEGRYPVLHDPAMGVSGARYYINKIDPIENGLQVRLDSWVIALGVFK
ncbi:hypothetical protein [Providencia phage PSTCR7]|uniref:Uncharacterized protein n=1 Tax=Providencia phage PSTCR7 TaxID=2783549 RepID=A0A7S9SWL0_9CAUD|nr:hypothetical protein PQD10_gp58 [Providencia phage PSTCR7]QPI18510.1 hypothetical protein [Providencia phage PSTCR7]